MIVAEVTLPHGDDTPVSSSLYALAVHELCHATAAVLQGGVAIIRQADDGEHWEVLTSNLPATEIAHARVWVAGMLVPSKLSARDRAVIAAMPAELRKEALAWCASHVSIALFEMPTRDVRMIARAVNQLGAIVLSPTSIPSLTLH